MKDPIAKIAHYFLALLIGALTTATVIGTLYYLVNHLSVFNVEHQVIGFFDAILDSVLDSFVLTLLSLLAWQIPMLRRNLSLLPLTCGLVNGFCFLAVASTMLLATPTTILEAIWSTGTVFVIGFLIGSASGKLMKTYLSGRGIFAWPD